MPVNAPIIGSLGLVGHTIKRIPDYVEKLAATGQMQRGRPSQCDKQRASGHFLRHGSAADRYLEGLRVLAESPTESTEGCRRTGELNFAVID